MQLCPYILRTVGKSYVEAFMSNPPLVRLEAGADGIPRITFWNADALGLPQPTEAEVAAILAAPEYVDLAKYAGNARWQKETGGITVGGISVATDDRSKQMVLGARVAADANPAFTTPWVGADGSIVELNAAQVIALSDAVLAHVAACFATFAGVKAGIAGGAITTADQIDAAFAAIG